MAEPSNISVENEKNAIDSTSSLSAMVKESFSAWLTDGNAKQYSPVTYLTCMDKVSGYLIRRKIVFFDLWQYTNFELFKKIYNKAINDGLFRATDKRTHAVFVHVGQAFMKFLKSKPVLSKVPKQSLEIDLHVNRQLTIKDAIIRVLETSQRGMTVEEIYNKITADRLYSFGAQNPQNVVRVEIDRACVNSNYTIRASEDCFRFERNQKGEKVYFLLASTLTDDTAQPTSINTTLADSEVKSITSTIVDESVKSAVVSILEERFSNGIRPKSVIDINKLKSYYFEDSGEEILLNNIDMLSLLNSIGIRHGEKVFIIPQSGKKELAELLDRLIAKGNHLFYYDEFYEAHADFLQEIHIFSSELLKTVLINILPSLLYSRNSFSTQNNVTVESEVLRCFENTVCLSYEQLKSKLPYVPLDKIKQVLAQNSKFTWVEMGVYTHTSKIEIDFNELHTIERKIEAELSKHEYVSLASLDVSSSLELNPELSETAVRNGLFQVCLADRYEKRGNIITPKGIALNSVVVFEDYCLTHDRLTLDELFNFEKEINGSINSQSLFIAYETMVRVDKDTFVSDRKIFFDVEATDNALALFINAEVIPLRAVTSFTSFPYIDGYPWNLFLLESYCRRFSKQFKFQCLSVSSRNVGAIFRKSAVFADYTTVLATAVANADVRLTEKEVGDFLFDSGYIARRAGVVSNVIAQARILIERIV